MAATLLFFVSALWSGEALATRPAMEPQIRLHLGASSVEGPSRFGLTGGVDSRMTRLLAMDIGGLISPFSMPEDVEVDAEETQDYLRLRHALYIAPGVRIPHRQGEGLSWDLYFRLGAAVAWSADLDPDSFAVDDPNDYRIDLGPAVLGGADLIVRKESVGLRVTGREFLSRVYHSDTLSDVWYLSPQFGLEALYQF